MSAIDVWSAVILCKFIIFQSNYDIEGVVSDRGNNNAEFLVPEILSAAPFRTNHFEMETK